MDIQKYITRKLTEMVKSGNISSAFSYYETLINERVKLDKQLEKLESSNDDEKFRQEVELKLIFVDLQINLLMQYCTDIKI
jgi:hypothetical protein